jgi:hypothetical protein
MPLTTYCPLDGILGDIVVGVVSVEGDGCDGVCEAGGIPTTGAA